MDTEVSNIAIDFDRETSEIKFSVSIQWENKLLNRVRWLLPPSQMFIFSTLKKKKKKI